jgi:hypothetical protein
MFDSISIKTAAPDFCNRKVAKISQGGSRITQISTVASRLCGYFLNRKDSKVRKALDVSN